MSSDSAKPEAHDKRIDTLFSRLGAIYGHIWSSNFQNPRALEFAKKEWSETLARFDNQILKEVLFMLREKKNFPPSLPQFVESCKAVFSRKSCHQTKKETITPASRSVAQRHLKAMLDLLNS